MANQNLTNAQALEKYRVSLENVGKQPEIATIMAEFGYGPETIAVGKQLLLDTRKAFYFNKQEDNETVEARADLDAKIEVISVLYRLHRKKAKVVFRNDDVVLKKLALTGSIPQAYVKWLETIKTFYTELDGDTKLLNKLARLKVAAQDITDGITAIASLEAARSEYLKEIGESQDATKAKDAAFATMDDWMRDFYAVSKIAMEDKPQLLEALGLLIRS
jgi:hypothetical protein